MLWHNISPFFNLQITSPLFLGWGMPLLILPFSGGPYKSPSIFAGTGKDLLSSPQFFFKFSGMLPPILTLAWIIRPIIFGYPPLPYTKSWIDLDLISE
jgi:hypothetical protein